MIMTEENKVYLDNKCVSDEPGLAFEINQLINDANQLADAQAEVERLKGNNKTLFNIAKDAQAEVERKLEAWEDLPKLWTGALFEWMGSLTRSGVKDEIEKCLQKCKPDTIDPPHPTVGDLKPGDFAVFITANDFWEGIKFSINRRKNTADGNNVSIYPLNGKCTAIQVSKLTPCKIVEG